MARMRRSNKWFERQAMILWQTYLLPDYVGRGTYFEVGVCECASLAWAVKHLKPLRAMGVDCYIPPHKSQAEAYAKYRLNMRKNLSSIQAANPKCNVRVEELSSREFFTCGRYSGWLTGGIDIAYVDGGHWGWDACEDAVLIWPYLRKGGVLIWDDLQRCWHQGKPQVRFGVRGFLQAYEGRYFRLYEEGRHFAIIKRG